MQPMLLSIPEPCHEDWDKMTPTQQGRYCNACAKQVVDFSTMSDTEVLNYFSKIKNEKVCGRAYPDQLERVITIPKEPKKRLFWYWNYITMLFLFFGKANGAKAQIGKVAVCSSKRDSSKPIFVTDAFPVKEMGIKTLINGKIRDEDGNPVSFASVIIKNRRTGVSADAAGNFSIKVDITNDIIEIRAVGFLKREVPANNLKIYNFILQRDKEASSPYIMLYGGVKLKKGINENEKKVDNPELTTILKVIDNATMQPIEKATVVIKKNSEDKIETVTTNKEGIYKIKKIREDDAYSIRVAVDGYIQQELEISGNDIDERKIVKQIFLEKKPTPNDFKKLDSIAVISYGTIKCSRISGAMSMVEIITINTFNDSLKALTTKISGTIKIYPNPVLKGNVFNLELKLKQNGSYHIQLIDAVGRVVMQKQIDAAAKLYTEQIHTSGTWSGGIYYVRVFDSNNKFISTSSLVIQ